MLIQVRVEKSGYFNLGDKNTLRLFDAKDNDEALELMRVIENQILDEIILENDYNDTEAHELIDIEEYSKTEEEWQTTTISHGNDYYYIMKMEGEKFNKDVLSKMI